MHQDILLNREQSRNRNRELDQREAELNNHAQFLKVEAEKIETWKRQLNDQTVAEQRRQVEQGYDFAIRSLDPGAEEKIVMDRAERFLAHIDDLVIQRLTKDTTPVEPVQNGVV